MNKLKFALFILVILGTLSFCSWTVNNVQAQKDTAEVELLPSGDVKVFNGNEGDLEDSLRVAESFVENNELKNVLYEARKVIETIPNKESSDTDWVSWVSAVLLLLGAVAGYILRYLQKKEDTKPVKLPTFINPPPPPPRKDNSEDELK